MHTNQAILGWLALLCAAPAAGAADLHNADYVNIQRGRYLANAGDCISCHTAKGGKPFAGGYPVETPFGTIYSSNITPDVVTGIGNWTREDFYRAMHEGKRKDGQHMYPACPYPWFTKMSREDVDDLKSYLDTLQPVRSISPENDLIWPLGWREMVAGWNLLFFEPGAYAPDPDKSTLWNRGAYLVQGPGHCAACHTPKNLLGGSDHDRTLQGGDAGEGWYAPGLTGNRRAGLGGWTTGDLVQYLKTGANPHTASTGPMTEVVMNSTRHLNEQDLRAIATYLKDIPPDQEDGHDAGDSGGAIDDETMARGKALYVDQCMGCHMADGKGQAEAFPPLANTSSVQAPNAQTLIQVVLGGDYMADPPTRPTSLAMPAFDWKLNDQDIADVLTYVRNSWGNRAPAVSADTVADMRESVHEYGPRYKRLISRP